MGALVYAEEVHCDKVIAHILKMTWAFIQTVAVFQCITYGLPDFRMPWCRSQTFPSWKSEVESLGFLSMIWKCGHFSSGNGALRNADYQVFKKEGSFIFKYLSIICAAYHVVLLPWTFRTMEAILECFKTSLSAPSQHLCFFNGF